MIDEKIKDLLCKGYTRSQIANELNLSKQAIDKRLQRIFKENNVKKNSELVQKLTMLRTIHEFL